MTQQNSLDARFQHYILERARRLGKKFGPNYAKDKVSRLRRLATVVSAQELSKMKDLAAFSNLGEQIRTQFPDFEKSGKVYHPSYDYLRVLRLVFEMNTDQPAPLYTAYRTYPKYRARSKRKRSIKHG